MTIQAVARATGLHVNTIRRADRRGLITARRDVNGYRRFEPEAVEQLKRLYLLGDAGIDAAIKNDR